MKIEFLVKKPMPLVFKILADLKAYGRYHPIITDVKHIEGNKYMVFESVRMVFFCTDLFILLLYSWMN